MKIRFISLLSLFIFCQTTQAQNPLTVENISRILSESCKNSASDSTRPGYHLIPRAGFMADPNGGIFNDGWYHIFYMHNPLSGSPGASYWGHFRSKDLARWEELPPAVTPYYEKGSEEVGSGSTIIGTDGTPIAFYSGMYNGSMKFWRATGNADLTEWKHEAPNPVLSLDFPGLPKFDKYWRDPFVFRIENRTFLICCADLFDEPNVVVPIFEAKNAELTSWDYKGILFSYPKYKLRNLEVPELRRLGNKWVLLASSDAPVDLTHIFVGNFDIKTLKFTAESETPLDYSGHFYAQETIQDDKGNLNLMGWLAGWDRGWMPNYQESDIKNSGTWWNGCFAIPRQLTLDPKGHVIQQPVSSMKNLRAEKFTMPRTELPVTEVTTSFKVLPFRGKQLEINLTMELGNAGFAGVNVFCNKEGHGGLSIIWSGDMINVDGVRVLLPEHKPGEQLQLHVFVDRVYVEIFINGGKYCVTRKVKTSNVAGDFVSLSSLSGTAILNSLEAWKLKTINEK